VAIRNLFGDKEEIDFSASIIAKHLAVYENTVVGKFLEKGM